MTGTDVSKLWDEALSLLDFHRKASDATPVDVVNRLVCERIAGALAVRLGPNTCAIREDYWPIDRLASTERKHQCDTPRHMIEPVIVVEYEGHALLIDGNNRVNEWLARGGNASRRVIVVRHG